MSSDQRTLVCVKQVKQDIKQEEWDESMLLPGDVIIGVAEVDDEKFYVPINSKSEFRSHLERLNRRVAAGEIWVKIRRGNTVVKLQSSIVTYRRSTFQRRFTIRSASEDDRHFAVLGDLTAQQCTEIQEISRKVVNLDNRGFNKKGVKYEWKEKVDTYLPDPRSTVISSILFMPLVNEHNIEATTARSMAWFSAAVSSGAPLVFVNIQTEQIIASEKNRYSGREKNYNPIKIVNGIRLWFLPGIVEVLIVLKPEPGETRIGIDIKRTEEGFICIYSVTNGSAADRAGLGCLQKEASEAGHLVVISRLDGKSVVPSIVSSTDTGLVHCCDIAELKGTIAAAIDETNEINLHVMGWPAPKAPPTAPPAICSTIATLMTPVPN